MSRDFPHVKFYGLDIGVYFSLYAMLHFIVDADATLVPIATRTPPRNVQFEMHDIGTALRFKDVGGSVFMILLFSAKQHLANSNCSNAARCTREYKKPSRYTGNTTNGKSG